MLKRSIALLTCSMLGFPATGYYSWGQQGPGIGALRTAEVLVNVGIAVFHRKVT